jgi:hypothetical protein
MEVVMRAAGWILVGAVGLACRPMAHGDDSGGLTLPRLQGRPTAETLVEVNPPALTSYAFGIGRLGGASLLGNYYFGSGAAREGEASGFRATSGVFLGSRLGMWGGHAPTVLSGTFVHLERHSFSLLTLPQPGDGASPESATLPYLGLGYSASSLKHGWGFSADLGLLALDPGSAVRLGRMFSGGQNLDDVLRDLRLSPLLQIGVSYSF